MNDKNDTLENQTHSQSGRGWLAVELTHLLETDGRTNETKKEKEEEEEEEELEELEEEEVRSEEKEVEEIPEADTVTRKSLTGTQTRTPDTMERRTKREREREKRRREIYTITEGERNDEREKEEGKKGGEEQQERDWRSPSTLSISTGGTDSQTIIIIIIICTRRSTKRLALLLLSLLCRRRAAHSADGFPPIGSLITMTHSGNPTLFSLALFPPGLKMTARRMTCRKTRECNMLHIENAKPSIGFSKGWIHPIILMLIRAKSL
ncbi:Hypothetical protein FKW44_000958 [Caligus rogercresseyi]|uniref:Uncharacterized protein n=1 Tax=Caligus rogercresseyi TaxID=217165 RepID=A0A7T8KI60_CALRO|nr:Hypothetical protein FKW44_000958 [Caligus rogercresseyi]